MKKHSFLFYFFLWPFLLLFAIYKYLFIALSHIISYIEYGIDYFISRHPIDFRSIFNHIKELIIYCYHRSVMISRIMYISILALNIIFTGFLFNSCKFTFQYIMVSLLFIFMLIVSAILASYIFLGVDKLVGHFRQNIQLKNSINENPAEIPDNKTMPPTSNGETPVSDEIKNDVVETLTNTTDSLQNTSGNIEPLTTVECKSTLKTNETTWLLKDIDLVIQNVAENIGTPSPVAAQSETVNDSSVLDDKEDIVDTQLSNIEKPQGNSTDIETTTISEYEATPISNSDSSLVTEAITSTTNDNKDVKADTSLITKSECVNDSPAPEEKENTAELHPNNTEVSKVNLSDTFKIRTKVSNSPISEESMHFPANASYTVSFEAFCRFIVEKGDATVSMLQTDFGITFFEAADLFSNLENYRIVGPDCPPRPRTVLVSLDELDTLFSNNIISDDDKKKVYKTNSPVIYDIVESDNAFKIKLKDYRPSNTIPYWKQLRNGKRMEFERNNIDLTTVTIFFHNGIICRIVPDVQSYYSARYYVIEGNFYDTYSLEDVKSIPIPVFNESYGTPVYNLEYLLKMRASEEREKENYELSYALMYKAIEGMKASRIMYGKKEYVQFIMWLYKDGRIEEAAMLEKRLRREEPEVFDINLFHKNHFLSEIKQCNDLGTDYVYCGGHTYTCSECAKYQNRVYSISGKDSAYPKLPDFVYEYGGFHPGCRHGFHPFFGDSIADKNGNYVDALEYSNRPFVDDRTPEEIEGYNQYLKKAEKERLRDENLKDFYILKKELPDVIPKSYSTFAKYKAHNSDKYINILNSANEKGITSSLLL
nr:MAG TPA: minor capsid protein [Caudoviricetes sp.]